MHPAVDQREISQLPGKNSSSLKKASAASPKFWATGFPGTVF